MKVMMDCPCSRCRFLRERGPAAEPPYLLDLDCRLELTDHAMRVRMLMQSEIDRKACAECGCGGPAGHVPNGIWCRK
jgi:hypothetical protein